MFQLIRTVFLNRWPQKILIIALAITAGLCGLLTPYYQKHFLENLQVNALWPASLLMLISFVTYQLTVYFSQCEALVAQKTLAEMLYQHILHLSSFAKMHRTTGELVSQYTSDIPSATIWLEQTLPYLLTTFLPLFFTPVFLKITYNVDLKSSILCVLIIMSLSFLVARRQSTFFYNFKRLAAERMTLVNEWIQNIKNLRLLGWIPAFEKNIFFKRELETDNRVSMVTNGQMMNAFSSSITYWLNLLVLIYFLATSLENIHKTDILVLIWVVGVFLSRPLRQLPWLLTLFFDGLTSVKRLHHFLSLENIQPRYPTQGFDFKDANFALRIKNLNLKLEGESLLKSIYLDLYPGEIVALIGPVGSGKSLLLKSIIKETPFEADYFYARPVSYLPQDPFIFSSTIHNNLSFTYEENYDENSSLASLQLGHFNETHKTGKDLLETLIGERGVNLSGGQKQRLHLSRLFHRPQPLFLLDDPFSAVDINTEKALITSLKKLQSQGHTFLVTTQRHTFLKYADRIIYLDKGQIVFNGPFAEFEKSPYENL